MRNVWRNPAIKRTTPAKRVSVNGEPLMRSFNASACVILIGLLAVATDTFAFERDWHPVWSSDSAYCKGKSEVVCYDQKSLRREGSLIRVWWLHNCTDGPASCRGD